MSGVAWPSPSMILTTGITSTYRSKSSTPSSCRDLRVGAPRTQDRSRTSSYIRSTSFWVFQIEKNRYRTRHRLLPCRSRNSLSRHCLLPLTTLGPCLRRTRSSSGNAYKRQPFVTIARTPALSKENRTENSLRSPTRTHERRACLRRALRHRPGRRARQSQRRP